MRILPAPGVGPPFSVPVVVLSGDDKLRSRGLGVLPCDLARSPSILVLSLRLQSSLCPGGLYGCDILSTLDGSRGCLWVISGGASDH